VSRTEDNKRLVQTFQQEVLHKGNYEKAREWAHEDLVIHLPPGMEPGLDNALGWFAMCAEWFTSTGLDVDLMVAEDDLVFQLITLHFEHTGDYMGMPPTGKRFSIGGLAAFRIRDGKIAEHWGLYDMASIPAQLGVEMPSFMQA
jgi:steroid delta-isomerase-like uncharacterized protein